MLAILRRRPPVRRADVAPRPPKPSPAVQATAREDAAELEQIRAEAHHHRDRLALYRARTLSPNPTSRTRLQELERISAAATERLARAERS